MPLTFSKECGTRTTNIFRLVGTLSRMGYKGTLVLNVKGLFVRSSVCLHRGFLRLMYKLAEEWENQIMLEQKRNESVICVLCDIKFNGTLSFETFPCMNAISSWGDGKKYCRPFMKLVFIWLKRLRTKWFKFVYGW